VKIRRCNARSRPRRFAEFTTGSASREKAQHKFLAAPDVLDGIIHDPGSSPKHKVDAIRELRACAAAENETATAAERERFTINISFGSHKISKEIELKPIKPELAIEAGDEHEGEYGF
jgi:hypothetical protein